MTGQAFVHRLEAYQALDGMKMEKRKRRKYGREGRKVKEDQTGRGGGLSEKHFATVLKRPVDKIKLCIENKQSHHWAKSRS